MREHCNGHEGGKDASGNPILMDIGKFLRDKLKTNCQGADVKYIDPTYMIRAIPASSTDRIYCKVLAHNAVHAAFSGYTGITVGLVNTHYVYLPIPVIILSPRTVIFILLFYLIMRLVFRWIRKERLGIG